jgi:hypothetical protein
VEPTLPFLLSLVTSYLVDGADKPEWPYQHEVHGLTDEQLWERITTDSDTLAGMSFESAVRTDPRRVDARLQQAVLNTFFAAVNVLGRAHNYGEMMAHAYLLRMAAMRKDGPVTAPKLAQAMREDWDYYSEILAVAFSMQADQAQKLVQALVDNRPGIYRGFREAVEVSERAEMDAATREDRQAWEEMTAVLRDMWAVVDEMVSKRTGAKHDAEPFGSLFAERFGAIHPGGEWEEYIVSGHRAPSHALPQFRRMGGRFYGGLG